MRNVDKEIFESLPPVYQEAIIVNLQNGTTHEKLLSLQGGGIKWENVCIARKNCL